VLDERVSVLFKWLKGISCSPETVDEVVAEGEQADKRSEDELVVGPPRLSVRVESSD
jgi:hypothetical protein